MAVHLVHVVLTARIAHFGVGAASSDDVRNMATILEVREIARAEVVFVETEVLVHPDVAERVSEKFHYFILSFLYTLSANKLRIYSITYLRIEYIK